MTGLDELLQQAADLRAAERATQWAMADLCATATSKRGDPMAGKLAEVWACSREWVLRLGRAGRMFGPELRYPDVPLGLYLAALRAADPQDALRQALEHGWSGADLSRRLGIGAGGATGSPCPTCGRRIPRRTRKAKNEPRSS